LAAPEAWQPARARVGIELCESRSTAHRACGGPGRVDPDRLRRDVRARVRRRRMPSSRAAASPSASRQRARVYLASTYDGPLGMHAARTWQRASE
jgi:hypothetical protein